MVAKLTNTISHGTILVVDDEKGLCKMLRTVLEKAGFQVHTAHNFDEANTLLKAHIFDAIFSDIFMPQKSGIELLKRIKDVQPEAPVIMMTGVPTVATASEALRLEAYDYLSKPVDINDLIVTAKQAVETKRLRDEKNRLEKLNQDYQKNLEHLVNERTAKLKESEERYRKLFEESKDAIYITRRDGSIIEMNQYATELLEYSRKEIQRMDARDFYSNPDDRIRFQSEIEEKGFIRNWETTFKTKSGKNIICLLTSTLLTNADNEIIGYQGIVRDITERRRLESIAEAANLMDNIGYIFSGIRHEIGNPVNSTKMTLSVLQKNLDSYSEEEIREYLKRALIEVGRIEYLLKALKNFSLFEHPEIRSVNILSFMEKLLPLVRKDIEDKGIQVTTDFTGSVESMLTDPRALQQVMLNLLINAADALAETDDPKIHIRTQKSSEFLTICVSDNGCGMTREELNHLFKPFYTTKIHGTGLGLVIVKRMLSNMNSGIEIESRKNFGTKITLSIPEGKGEQS